MSLADALFLYSNLYRRFGLGSPKEANESLEWQGFIKGLEPLKTHRERLDWIQRFYLDAKPEPIPDQQIAFGCFHLDAQPAPKPLRIHFLNTDTDGVSPLAPAKRSLRKQELSDLFGYVKVHFPESTEVMGISWLYHFPSYRSLFPKAYGDSRVPFTGMTRFQGSSSWGQFLQHDGSIKTNLKADFLQRLERLNLTKPWEVFPLPTYQVRLGIEPFYDVYDIP